jgi:hypothetical protein
MSQKIEKNPNPDYFFTKEQKSDLTHQAFWSFIALCNDRSGVDLLNFQKHFRSKLYPNRQTPKNDEQKKIQHYQDVQINRIIQEGIPNKFPNVEIVKTEQFLSKMKFRPFIRLKTYNYQNAIERKSHSEFLKSDMVKISGLTNSDLLRNIKANLNLIEKYKLQDIRDKSNGITANFSEKNIQKWKDGVVRIPAPLLLLVICAVHKWIEANAMKLKRGRPRKIEGFDNQELAAFVVGSSELLGLGNYPLFNSQIITQVYLIFHWWNEIDVALDNGLDEDETAKAIWNLYGKDISYNPMIQHENYFNIKHVREEVSKKFEIKEQLKQVREMLIAAKKIPKNATDLEVTNGMLAMTKQMGVTANNEASVEKRKAMYGELINCYFDHTSELLKLYNAIFKEFTFIDSKEAYRNHMDHMDHMKKNVDKKDVVIQENEENKFENPEDYFGI